jgi:hypothetical protein
MLSRGRAAGEDRAIPTARPRAMPAAGLKILVPGYAQWSWRQRERGLVLFGSFVMALGVAVFAWGTALGMVVLAFAFGTHVASAVDVIRQGSFPGFGRWMPLVSASGGLAAGVYAPALGVATLLAWPAMPGAATPDGYLVNRRAFRDRAPRRGEWVWLRSSPWGDLRVGRVMAGAGQEVEWSGQRMRVAGTPAAPGMPPANPFRSSYTPEEMTFTVPEGHVLVNLDAGRRPGDGAGGTVLIPHDQVVGRAWARLYPISGRELLHE